MSVETNVCELIDNADGSISYYLAGTNPLRLVAVEDLNGVVQITKPDIVPGLALALEKAGKRVVIAA